MIVQNGKVYIEATAAELTQKIDQFTQLRDEIADLERNIYGGCIPIAAEGEWERIVEVDAANLYDDDHQLPQQLATAGIGDLIVLPNGLLKIDRLVPEYDRGLRFTRTHHGGFNPSLTSPSPLLFNPDGLIRAGETYRLSATLQFGENTHEVLQDLLDAPGNTPWWRLLQVKNIAGGRSWYADVTWALDWYRADAHQLTFLLLGDSHPTKPSPGTAWDTNEQKVFPFDASKPLQVILEQRLSHTEDGMTKLWINNVPEILHNGPNCVQRTDGIAGTEGQCRGIYIGSYLGPCQLSGPLTVTYRNISLDVLL